ncbi:MAG: ABC transporter ATP-binding protein [Lachnospiraceae bacterium]|nr:ABC transporter ATP-binding protein [Lachnospiraceae bacterium]
MTENNLELHNVSKTFSEFSLHDISFELPKGYIMGLVGSNGAGKTTTLNLIMNMMKKDDGSIKVFGKDHLEYEKQIKQEIGIVYDSNFFVDTWTVKELEKALSMFYDEWNHDIFIRMKEQFELPDKTRIGKMSRGMQMKLMLACACSHNAKLLLLDEPTSGLDPTTRSEILDILQDYIQDGEKSVLFSTHITTDLEKVADYITYLEHGRIVYTGSMEELLAKYCVIKGAPGELTEGLRQHLIGLSQTALGFEGLIKTDTAKKYKGFVLDTPTVDEIIVHIGKEAKRCQEHSK